MVGDALRHAHRAERHEHPRHERTLDRGDRHERADHGRPGPRDDRWWDGAHWNGWESLGGVNLRACKRGLNRAARDAVSLGPGFMRMAESGVSGPSTGAPARSESAERGFANCPAMRPTFTTGIPAAKFSTTAICSSTRKVSRIVLVLNSAKLSAQSPPWSRKASPRDAFASSARTSSI